MLNQMSNPYFFCQLRIQSKFLNTFKMLITSIRLKFYHFILFKKNPQEILCFCIFPFRIKLPDFLGENFSLKCIN